MRSERAFGGTKVYGITVDCPCKGCDLRGCGCASICDAYKKYKFILTILKKNRQAKVRAASEIIDDKEYMKGILRGCSASQVSSLYNRSFLKVRRGL